MPRLINRRPGWLASSYLTAIPFIILVVAYFTASHIRLSENPNDKLLPSIEKFGAAINRLAFEQDRRTGQYTLWVDTGASLARLGMGIGISTAIGLILGIAIGLIPYIRSTLAPLVAVISLIPPLAILPILFIIFGLGEVAKVVLIIIGITPFLIRDLSQRVMEIPIEQIVKAQTLGANSWQIITRLALPQVLPRLISAVRLSLGPAWLYLISSEAIAATAGMGYRIFLVRRYLAMDVIIPYVVWITLLAFLLDYVLRFISRRSFKWMGDEATTL